MEVGPLRYKVCIKLRFSVPEADALKTCAEKHYDYEVRRSAREGAIARVARLAVLNTAERHPEDAPDAFFYPLSTSEIDIMMKALEEAHYADHATAAVGIALKAELLAAFRRATAEWCRLSGVEYTP